jgi:hypothetical protein
LKDNLKYRSNILSLFTKEKSVWVWLLSVAAILGVHQGHNHDEVLNWDVFGYYLYLPALLIHQDVYLQQYDWVEALFQNYEISTTFYQAIKWETGNWVIRYTPGMSVLYFPFFIIGHVISGISGLPQDGLSLPYQYSIDYGMLVYPILGLWYTRKWLRRYFNDIITACSMFILVFGTNFLHLAGDTPALTHAPLFALYAIFLYHTDLYFSEKSKKRLLLSGLTAGLIILIRPTEAVLLCIPFLWNNPLGSASGFLSEIKKRVIAFLPAGLFIILILLPMLAYWKFGAGSWLINSYRNPGEGLDFLDPHFRLFLFSFRKGWFIYTPLSAMMLFGLWMMFRKKAEAYPALGIFFLLSLYISASWTCWWYAGGCYSQRNMVQVYASLALPLAYCTDYLLKVRILPRLFFITSTVLLIALNLFQHWQFRHDIIDHERMTGGAYKKAILKLERTPALEAALLINRSTGEDEWNNNLSGLLARPLRHLEFQDNQTDPGGGIRKGQKTGYVGGDKEFLDIYKEKIAQLTEKYYFWLKVSVMVYIPKNYTGNSQGLVVHFDHKEGAYKYRHKTIENSALKKGAWNEISMAYLSPEPRSKEDLLKIYLWHPSTEKVLVDDINVIMLEPEAENPVP